MVLAFLFLAKLTNYLRLFTTALHRGARAAPRLSVNVAVGTFPGVRTVVASDKTRAAPLQQYQRSSTEAPTRHPRHNRFAGLGCAHKRSSSPTHTFSKLSRKDASPQATQSCTGLDLFLRKPISIAPQRRHPLCSNFRSLYVIRHALIINC